MRAARLAAMLLLAASATVCAQTAPVSDASAPLFDDSALHTIQLRVNARDWKALVDNYGENTYYPVDIVVDGQVVRNVGIRSRGSGSRNPNKPGLKVDFNHYADQQFLGLTSLVLDNLYQDFTMLRERVAMKFYERLGLPAPRESSAKVFVNNEYMGVYAIAESIDKKFLKRVGYDNDGYLYEFNWLDQPWQFEDLGGDVKAWQARFDPKTHEKDGPAGLFGPLQDFVRVTADTRAVTRDVGEYLDIEQFLRYLAVESYLADWDGIVGNFGMNNFYLYRPPDSARFHFIPWDKDNTFKGADYPFWPDGMNSNVLTERLMSVPELRQFFLNAVDECAKSAGALTETTDSNGQPLTWLQLEIERQYEQIHEAGLADDKKTLPNGGWQYSVDLMRQFARDRSGYVSKAVAERRR